MKIEKKFINRVALFSFVLMFSFVLSGCTVFNQVEDQADDVTASNDSDYQISLGVIPPEGQSMENNTAAGPLNIDEEITELDKIISSTESQVTADALSDKAMGY